MMSQPRIDNIENLRSAHNAFAWTMELVELHGSSEACLSAERTLTEFSCQLPQSIADRVRLAVLYSKRVGSGESPEQLLHQLDGMAVRCVDDHELALLVRAVKAAVLLIAARRYDESMHALEELFEELRDGGCDVAYGIVRRTMGAAHMFCGQYDEAEMAYQDAIAVFRRYRYSVALGGTLNDYGVLKKRLGEYVEATSSLREALRIFGRVGVVREQVHVIANIGIVETRKGNWATAQKYYTRAASLLESSGLLLSTSQQAQLHVACLGKQEHLDLLRRRYVGLAERLGLLIEREDDKRAKAILLEDLGDLMVEIEEPVRAEGYLNDARQILETILPNSDAMAEVLRRIAQLRLFVRDMRTAKEVAIQCIQLSRRIGDRYELGAACRVLGEVYAAEGDLTRARVCLLTGIRELKSMHECYELMRALLSQGRVLAASGIRDDAEISLLEARQLARRLEIEYYQALIAIALVDVLIPQERWPEATSWLKDATTALQTLKGTDHDRVEKEVKRVAGELQTAITRVSVREAEKLKTICRVYEDARFPIVEMRADLAYQVAQSAGGTSLFFAARRGGGYTVPLTYNIAMNEAKEMIRRMDSSRKDSLLGLGTNARVFTLPTGKTLVAIPIDVSPPRNGKDPVAETYAFCTCFESGVTVTPRQMEILVASADALARLIEDNEERHAPPTADELARARHPRGSFKDILTIDPGMIKVIKFAEKAAASVAPILLQGDTGVGKELFARAMHEASRRKEGPFVAVNAGGMPVSLLESELFGHVKGAFTDAGSDRQGVIDMARGGTLFLDEIGEMGEELQVKLLRLLENGEYRRLGESTMRKADVRVISATNKDLADEVERGRFRRDLFYRVSPLKLTIPPLRMRSVDIQLMVRHFLRDCAEMNGIGGRAIEIDVKAMEALELYDWPGNVRELHNEILRVVSLIGRGDFVRFSMLSENIQQHLHSTRRGSEGLLERTVDQFERRLILRALEKNDWNQLRTAEAIGLPRTTLIAKLRRLNISARL